MFTNHFKMTGQPFVERAPVEQILRDERIQQGLARLQYFVYQGEIAVLTGQAGIGKSTLLKPGGLAGNLPMRGLACIAHAKRGVHGQKSRNLK